MVLTNSAISSILNNTAAMFTNGGVGLNNTTEINSDTGLFGGETIIDTCDSITGWNTEGDASSVILNNDDGEYVEGSGCINIVSSSSSGSLGVYKTVTSFDATNKILAVWYYINDASEITNSDSSLKITLGTGGFTNANEYYKPNTDLSNGWNSFFVNLNNTADNVLGTGLEFTNCDSIKFSVLTTINQSGNNQRIDFWRFYEADTLGVSDSVKPLIKITGTNYFKTSHTITTTESNGLEIVESGDSNTELLSRQTFATVVKGQDTELQIDKYYYIEDN